MLDIYLCSLFEWMVEYGGYEQWLNDGTAQHRAIQLEHRASLYIATVHDFSLNVGLMDITWVLVPGMCVYTHSMYLCIYPSFVFNCMYIIT